MAKALEATNQRLEEEDINMVLGVFFRMIDRAKVFFGPQSRFVLFLLRLVQIYIFMLLKINTFLG